MEDIHRQTSKRLQKALRERSYVGRGFSRSRCA